jgi:hypothetical protein
MFFPIENLNLFPLEKINPLLTNYFIDTSNYCIVIYKKDPTSSHLVRIKGKKKDLGCGKFMLYDLNDKKYKAYDLLTLAQAHHDYKHETSTRQAQGISVSDGIKKRGYVVAKKM